jgi:hypothetical protein
VTDRLESFCDASDEYRRAQRQAQVTRIMITRAKERRDDARRRYEQEIERARQDIEAGERQLAMEESDILAARERLRALLENAPGP